MAAVGHFLAGIGALIWDPDRDRYLLLKRSNQKDFAAGSWECVTGRVNQSEGFEVALYREILEETGLEAQPYYILGTTHFYRGDSIPENELVGVVYCCSFVDEAAADHQIQLTTEHSEYRWVTANEALDLLQTSNPTENWLRLIVERAEKIKSLIPVEILTINKRYGFEFNTFNKP